MAQTTVELRNLLKTGFELFDFDYSFDDERMKDEIEQAVIDYFFFSEIGQETPDRFKHVFKTRFLRAISYYNKLHNTTLLEYNPLVNYSISEGLERLSNTTNETQNSTSTQGSSTDKQTNKSDSTNTTKDTSTSESSSNSNSLTTSKEDEQGNNVLSDYPQQSIGTGSYLDNEQLSEVNRSRTDNTTGEQTSTASGSSTVDGTSSTNATINSEGSTIGEQTTSGTGKGNEQETYEKAIEGITGKSYQELIQLERENIIRIKQMIIRELKPCFMMTY